MVNKILVFPLLLIIGIGDAFSQSACDLSTYNSAYIINTNDYPYTSPGTGITISASASGVSTLNNFSYSCNGQTFNTASPAWWINSASQTITLTFSAPVTAFSVTFNGTNAGEEFYFAAGSGTVSLSDYCTTDYVPINSNTGLQYNGSGTSGNHVAINHPTGETTFTLRHNGVGSGSRIAVLDCIVPATPLPITLSSFDVSCVEGVKILEWTTSSEINNDYFSIQKSLDAENFHSIGRVEGAGYSNSLISYKWSDDQVNEGGAYYRLKQTDFDGKKSYSEVEFVKPCFEIEEGFNIYPNPADNYLKIRKNTGFEILSYFISDIAGKKVKRGEAVAGDIDISNLDSGVYLIQLRTGSGIKVRKFLKE